MHKDPAEITHRFESLLTTPDNKVILAWIDKRDLEAAKSGKKGAALSEAAHPEYEKIKVYQLTNAGLALQATAQGYKYWPDDDLNGRKPAPVTSVK